MPQPQGAEPEEIRARREQLRGALAAAGIEYLGPDRGVEDSLYFRDPNGVGLELYREELGLFNGAPLLR
jgi:glyoxylase I family protein